MSKLTYEELEEECKELRAALVDMQTFLIIVRPESHRWPIAYKAAQESVKTAIRHYDTRHGLFTDGGE